MKVIPAVYGTAMYWVAAIAYTLQIYFDFSGYSDMAIGLGRMFGFHFLENFNYPYIALSITDFWRRWHISLSSWFRDYIYTAWRKQGRKVKTYIQYPCCVDNNRILARCTVEFCALGTLLCSTAFNRKASDWKIP